jgi:asparagine synthase (glutamine-hydrolysing)
MCGIFGWIGGSQTLSDETLAALSRLLAHRGPDDSGYECGQGWGLGFRRLSILDLSPLGHQPMCTPDGRFWIVFNGEIYNYVELRRALESHGEQFRGGSDTEVILRLFALEGAKALQSFNGMFSLCIIDAQEQTFFIARDRLGVKPLYYHVRGGQLRFASELKALLAWPDSQPVINSDAVLEYLTQNYLSAETSIFQDFHKLPPGHFLTGGLNHPERALPQRYWHLDINDEEGEGELSEPELADLHELLANAVSIRLRSDVPVGIFLSGGLDSGLVAVMAGEAIDGAKPLAMTVGFPEKAFDESDLALQTARRAGLEHRVIEQQPGELADIDRLAWFYDEPFGDVSALPMFALCEAATKHATVFLSGDGGDEAFAGYARYVKARRYDWMARIPTPAHHALRALSHSAPVYSSLRFRMVKSSFPDGGFAAAFDTVPDDPAIMAILHPNMKALAHDAGKPLWSRWKAIPNRSLTARQQALDYALYLPDDILVKTDRASMAHSIELRSPMVDYRVVEWAARLPRARLLNAVQGKLPLRTLGEKLLPPQVQREKKRGFDAPVGAWVRQPAGMKFARERLLSDEARRLGFWDTNAVDQLLTTHETKTSRNFGVHIWRLLMLDAWARHYLNGGQFMQGAPPPRVSR